MAPERVAPGRPLRGVRPMDVSRDWPFLMAHAEAPDPRCKTIRLRDEGCFWRNWDIERRMNASERVELN